MCIRHLNLRKVILGRDVVRYGRKHNHYPGFGGLFPPRDPGGSSVRRKAPAKGQPSLLQEIPNVRDIS
jgi:hypothetical protein